MLVTLSLVAGCVDIGSGPPPDAGDAGTADAAGGPADGSTDAAAAVETVEMRGIKFIPTELTVAPGTEVVWEHHDSSTPHTIRAGTPDAPGDWESPQLEGGETYSRIFEEPGAHDYYCTQHPQAMQGVVEVVP